MNTRQHTNPDGTQVTVPTSASIGNGASIGNYASIVAPTDVVCVVGLFGQSARCVSIYRTERDGKTGHEVTAGCFVGSLDDMAANLKNPAAQWPGATDEQRAVFVAEYKAIRKMFKLRAAQFTGAGDAA